MIPILNILIEQAKTLHIPFDTIPLSLPQTSPLLGSLSLHLNTMLEPVCIIFNLYSTCLNQHSRLLSIDKPTTSSPNNSLTSTFFLVLQIKTTHRDPSKHTHLIPIQLCFMLHLHWPRLVSCYYKPNFLHNLTHPTTR